MRRTEGEGEGIDGWMEGPADVCWQSDILPACIYVW